MATTMLTLDDIVSKTGDLPALPTAVLAVLRETDSSTSTAQSVARYLSQDQALTARVLRLANSAFYGMQRKISNISEAVVILGMRNVRNLAMVASTYPWMKKPLSGYGLAPKDLWSHSMAVGLGAQRVATKAKNASAESAFTAGLLHNLGKVAMSIWLDGKLEAFVEIALRERLTFDEVERKVLGYDHCDVGAHIGRGWNLPEDIVLAMQYHHRPNLAPEPHPTLDCVHVADFLAMSLGIGLGGDGLRYEFCEDTLVRLGLGPEVLEQIADEMETAYEQHEKLFEEMAA